MRYFKCSSEGVVNRAVRRSRALGELAQTVACATILLTVTLAAATPRPTPTATPSPAVPESFLSGVLRFLGVSHDPSSLKGPGDEVVTGQLWIADLSSKSTRKLTSNGGYRSPVFVPGSPDVIALKGDEVVRVRANDGNESALFAVNSITKLVGFRDDDPTALLVLLGGTQPHAGILSLKSAAVQTLPYNASSSRDREMLAHLAGWERDYGNTSLYVKRESKQTVSGTIEWSDVFLKTGSGDPVDTSQCGGVDCGQPSLSPDGTLVVFVRSDSNQP